MRKPLLKHTQIIRLGRILNMLYKPSELAAEIRVNVDTIYRSYLPAGLPHTRDKDLIWIHGPAFVAWAKQTVSKRRADRHPLAPDQAWCMTCNGPVLMQAPQVRQVKHRVELVQGRCPQCGIKVNRLRARGGQ